MIACRDAGWQMLQLRTPIGLAGASPIEKKVKKVETSGFRNRLSGNYRAPQTVF